MATKETNHNLILIILVAIVIVLIGFIFFSSLQSNPNKNQEPETITQQDNQVYTIKDILSGKSGISLDEIEKASQGDVSNSSDKIFEYLKSGGDGNTGTSISDNTDAEPEGEEQSSDENTQQNKPLGEQNVPNGSQTSNSQEPKTNVSNIKTGTNVPGDLMVDSDSLDIDGDKFTNYIEKFFKSDPYKKNSIPDTCGEKSQIKNKEEPYFTCSQQLGNWMTSGDTDKDGFPDLMEEYLGSDTKDKTSIPNCGQFKDTWKNPNNKCLYVYVYTWGEKDFDGDKFTNIIEHVFKSDPYDKKSIPENCGTFYEWDEEPNHSCLKQLFDWFDEDFDGDKFTNVVEDYFGTDPNNNLSFPKSCKKPNETMEEVEELCFNQTVKWAELDTDGDKFTNKIEVLFNSNYIDKKSVPASCGTATDEGFQECSAQLLIWSEEDFDGDSIANGQEIKDGTDPNDKDSHKPLVPIIEDEKVTDTPIIPVPNPVTPITVSCVDYARDHNYDNHYEGSEIISRSKCHDYAASSCSNSSSSRGYVFPNTYEVYTNNTDCCVWNC